MGRTGGKKMKIAKRDGARCFWPLDMDRRSQRRHRHAHIRWIRGDAVLACAEYGKRPIVAGDRGAAAAGLALVAPHGSIAEVDAASSLQHVSANSGHVADLRRGAL